MYYCILITFVSLFLFWLIIQYLSKNFYIIENFDPNALLYYNTNSPDFSHTVDLPLNTKYSSCLNFCGPKARCAITGTQCLADIDCSGCQPVLPPPPPYLTAIVKPYFGSGNLTYNINPQYSKLTTDIGSRALFFDKNAEVPKTYLGIDKWTPSFNYGLKLADDKLAYQYSAAHEPYKFLPSYPTTETVTGLFYDIGPTASNAYL
jgi:hypothetical protein